LLASDGGIDYRWGLGGLRPLAAAAGRNFHRNAPRSAHSVARQSRSPAARFS